MEVFVVIPAHNECQSIKQVLAELQKQEVKIVVVDDGSKDCTAETVQAFFTASSMDGIFCQHKRNRGLGAALKTGIRAALDNGADIILTFDADGQHSPDDIPAMVAPLAEGKAEVVLGNRNFWKMPLDKGLGNLIMNVLTKIFYGLYVKDSQVGLRAFSSGAIRKMDLNKDDYGISSEIIREIGKKKLRLVEVPIKTIYSTYSISKGTGTKIGLRILSDMIRDRFRIRSKGEHDETS